jgi:hypothetical protein
MNRLHRAAFAVCFGCFVAVAVNAEPRPQLAPGTGAAAQEDASTFSGEYEFLREGQLLQLTIQPGETGAQKNVTGFVSRQGDSDSDRGTVLDHWIHGGTLLGSELQFRTSTIHGVWFEFQGSIIRGAALTRHEKGYYMIRGKLIRHVSDRDRKESAESREVTLNLLPDPEAEQ